MLFVVMYRNWLWLKFLSTAHLSNFSYKSFKFDVVITWQRGNLQTSGGTYELPLLSSTSVQPFGRQSILGDPGAASWDDGIFMGESLQQERESPWALTLTERVPEAFEIPPWVSEDAGNLVRECH